VVTSTWRAAVLVALLVEPLSAQTRDWTPEERAVVGDFTRITAVATSTDRVFVVSPTAVIAWDALAHRWSGPWQPRDPASLSDVFLAFTDPLDGGLWLVRRGGWLRFDPGIQLWEQGTVPGGVVDAALDQDAPGAGLFLRVGSGWFTASRGGAAFPSNAPRRPLRAATLDEAIRNNPAIQANSASLLTSSRLRNVRYTAVARSQGFTGIGWYLGTSGAGVLFLADGSGIADRLPYGLPTEVVAALFAGTGGVWAVTERTQVADPGLTFVAANLSEFRSLQGPRATGLPFVQARRVVGLESELWLATDGGVIRISAKTEDAERYDEGRGLPDSRVLALAQRRGRIVAGTAHGLAIYADSTGFRRLAPGFSDAAYAVTLSGDTTWVGTRIGLFAALPGEPDLLQPDALRESIALQAPVVALTWRADTLVALLEDRLLWRSPGTGRFTLGPLLGSTLGRLHTVINGSRGLYIAGDRGVGIAGIGTPLRRALTAPGDLPGQVTDIAVDETYLWVATLRGLVRLQLDAIGQ
jgi:hypothetical protein